MKTRVLIADDHPVVRDGLRYAIEHSHREIEVVAEASDGYELLKAAEAQPIDVFIIDITMPGMNGLDAARALIRTDPGAKIIILSLHGSRALVEEAMGVGARGYLTKETVSRKLVEAVEEVNAGRYYFGPDVLQFMVDKATTGPVKSPGSRRSGLTTQERRILQLIAEGRSAKEIATQMGRSVHTINAHRKSLMGKLGLHRQADLVRYALREGLGKL